MRRHLTTPIRMEEGVCPTGNNSLCLIFLSWKALYSIHSSKEGSQTTRHFNNSQRSLQGTWSPQDCNVKRWKESCQKSIHIRCGRCTTLPTEGFHPIGWSQWICGDLYYPFMSNTNLCLGKQSFGYQKMQNSKRKSHLQEVSS